MRLQLNYQSGVPPYLQIAEQIKRAAASGRLRTGDPLPSIRPLAERLRVNRNTVAKAYAALEHEGVIETKVGKGSFLAKNASPYTKAYRDRALTELIDSLIAQAHHFQTPRAALIRLVEARWDAFDSERRQGPSESNAPHHEDESSRHRNH